MDMNFRGNDPGAVQYGNFINYYQFNSAEERLNLLPKGNLWKIINPEGYQNDTPYVVLDIGCNSGAVTQLVYTFLKNELQTNVKILGIDIDSTLIERAKDANKFTDDIKYQSLDVMDMKNSTKILQEFLNSYNKTKFNAIFCLSITMWIHLNHQDEGLQNFLRLCSNFTHLLVIEPQPWKCYQTAIRRLRRVNDAFPNFHKLKWRSKIEQEIENYLEQCLGLLKVYESKPTKWKRKICVYRND